MMKKTVLLVTLFLLFAAVSLRPHVSEVSLDPDKIVVKPALLRSFDDPILTDALMDRLMKDRHWKTLIQEKKMAVSLVDLQDGNNPRFASVNGDEMMYAASLPKIAILLAAMDAIEKGELKVDPVIKQDMRIMISQSDNHAASRMIDRLGYDKIEEVLTHPEYRLYDKDQGGGLWVGKRYGRKGKRNPDPLKGLSHAATSNQVARFYYLMERGELVSPQRSQEMMGIMQAPELHHKFVNTLDDVAPQAAIYRKSGSWRNYHADSALVKDDLWRNYILVALIDDAEGEAICRELVRVAEEVLRSTRHMATMDR